MALGSVVVVMLGMAFTVIVSGCVSIPALASVTLTVKLWVVAVVPTAPVMIPEEVPSVSPAGSAPLEIDHV